MCDLCCEQQYQIEKGDTLSSIALRFDLTPTWIKKSNNLFSDAIFPGDTLVIKPPETSISHITHVTQRFRSRLHKPRPGRFLMLENSFRFCPENTLKQPVAIDMVNIYKTKVTKDHKNVQHRKTQNFCQNANNQQENNLNDVHNVKNEKDVHDVKDVNSLKDLKDENDVNNVNDVHVVSDGSDENIANKADDPCNDSDANADCNSYEIGRLKIIFVDQNEKTSSSLLFSGDFRELTNFNTALTEKCTQIQAENNITIDITEYERPPHRRRRLRVMSEPDIFVEKRVLRRVRSLSLLESIEIVNGPSNILNEILITNIRTALQMRWKQRNWKLIYQLSRDGTSLTALFTLATTSKPAILVISTENGEKIGAFLPLGFKRSEIFYGNGQTFVFSQNNDGFNVYRWDKTSNNDYYISSSYEGISIGGGGAPAIYIDNKLRYGISEYCKTFDSQQLTSNSHFKIIDMELFVL